MCILTLPCYFYQYTSIVVPSAIAQQVTMATSRPLEVPIPTYIPPQQQPIIPAGYNQGQHLTNPSESYINTKCIDACTEESVYYGTNRKYPDYQDVLISWVSFCVILLHTL